MDKNDDSGSPGWGSSFFVQTTEEVAKAVAAAASTATVRSSRPSVVFSSKDDNYGSHLQKLQFQVTKLLKGLASPPKEKRGPYNPEILTSQKRQWARFQLQSLDHRPVQKPSKLFESMVVVGLPPTADIQLLQDQILKGKYDSPKKSRRVLNYQHHVQAAPNLQPKVLFAYPPEKELPLKYKDLLSFCLPGGMEVHAIERTPSLSELNEILLGQEQLKQSDLSFVFRLQVADDSTLYGCCVLVEEIVQKPSRLVSMLSEEQHILPTLSRHIITTTRCYCIISRLPFFKLHFGVLRSIFAEERLERLRSGLDIVSLLSLGENHEKDNIHENSDILVHNHICTEGVAVLTECSAVSLEVSQRTSDNGESKVMPMTGGGLDPEEVNKNNTCCQDQVETDRPTAEGEPGDDVEIGNDEALNKIMGEKQPERLFPEVVLPLLRYHHYESSESSGSLQGSPSYERNLRSDQEMELEEPSSSGHEDSSDHSGILQWAKANNHGSLQIICEYYQFQCPARGSTLTFQPLEHLHPLEFHRPGETALHIAGSTIDFRSCSTSLELAEARNALLAEEEAISLSVWTVACICGSLRLEHVLTLITGALLEKQIVIISSNLGFLSASVLSVVPLIRPYQWQSLLMPVLPNDMLDFLDAPVPYIVGIKNMTAEVQSKLMNAILIDANKNQVRTPPIPQLPRHKELFSSLSPFHAKLVGESYLARKRPVHEYTDVQVEAAKGFLAVLRSYLDSLCSNLRSHTITNVQSNDDKVSLLLKESFIDSFPSQDRHFVKLFVDTQLFSVCTDLVLSFYQKD